MILLFSLPSVGVYSLLCLNLKSLFLFFLHFPYLLFLAHSLVTSWMIQLCTHNHKHICRFLPDLLLLLSLGNQTTAAFCTEWASFLPPPIDSEQILCDSWKKNAFNISTSSSSSFVYVRVQTKKKKRELIPQYHYRFALCFSYFSLPERVGLPFPGCGPIVSTKKKTLLWIA